MIRRDEAIRSSTGRQRLSKVLREAGPVITVADATRSLGASRSDAAKILARWVKQGWLSRLRRGLYSSIPIEASQRSAVLTNPWVVIPSLFSPGYVGGWSAAEHWDLTEQIFRSVCVLSQKQLRRKEHQIEGTAFVVTRVPERSFFGLQSVWVGETKILVSDPHKTIVDILSAPSLGGGIRHVSACLRSYSQSRAFDPKKLISYGDRLGNGAVFKRLGFLHAGQEQLDQKLISACATRLTKGLAQLDPAQPGEHVVTRWRLRIPGAWKSAE